MTRKRGASGPRERRLVFGVGPVRELCASHPEDVSRVLVANAGARAAADAREAGVSVEVVSRAELDRRAGAGARHQGVIAEVGPYRYAELEDLLAAAEARGEPALLVALDGVTDPQNLGAIARSAYVLGAHGMLVPQDRAAPVNAAATKASAGATEVLRIARVKNLVRALEELRSAGLWRVAVAASEGAASPVELDGTLPLCLVLGGEGEGIRRLVAKRCDFRVEIPMSGRAVGSLNVSVAAGVLLYEVSRQRRAAGA